MLAGQMQIDRGLFEIAMSEQEPESCEGQRQLREDESRSSAAGCADGCSCAQDRRERRPAGKLSRAPWS